MQLWLHSICELQLLTVKQRKGYFLNAYHCWALLIGHLSCYKQFFLSDECYKCKLFCNYCGRLNTFYFESKKERKISGCSKALWILQPDQNMPSTTVSDRKYIFNLFTAGHRLCFVKKKKKKRARESKIKLESYLQSRNPWLS